MKDDWPEPSFDPRRAAAWLPQTLLFAFVFALGLFSAHSPMTWMHLATGEIIARQGLPAAEPFSYAAASTDWHTHDWLAEEAFARVLASSGSGGLVAGKALLLAFGFALLWPLGRAEPLIAAGALGTAAAGAWPGFAELPSVFDFPLLALLLRLLRPARTPSVALGASAAALVAFWANLHPAGAVFAVVVVSLKALPEALKTGWRERAAWAGVVAAAAGGALLNPYGAETLSHALAGLGRAGPAAPPSGGFASLYGLFAAAGLGAAWVCLQEEPFLTLAAMSLLGLSVVSPDWAPLYLLAAGPLIAIAAGHFATFPVGTGQDILGLALGFMCLFLWHDSRVARPLERLRGFASEQTPEGALRFLDDNRLSGRLFNDLGSAPYIAWRTLGRRRLFVDPRPGRYDPGLADDARHWPQRWPSLDAAYRFDYALVENNAGGYPCRAIDEDPAWELAYWDDASLVYRRRAGSRRDPGSGGRGGSPGPGEGAFARLRPNNLFEPFASGALSTPESARRAAASLDAAMRLAPEAVGPMLLGAMALDAAGERSEASRLLRRARTRPLWKPELRALYGLALERRGEVEAARGAYRKSLEHARLARDGALAFLVEQRLASLGP